MPPTPVRGPAAGDRGAGSSCDFIVLLVRKRPRRPVVGLLMPRPMGYRRGTFESMPQYVAGIPGTADEGPIRRGIFIRFRVFLLAGRRTGLPHRLERSSGLAANGCTCWARLRAPTTGYGAEGADRGAEGCCTPTIPARCRGCTHSRSVHLHRTRSETSAPCSKGRATPPVAPARPRTAPARSSRQRGPVSPAPGP